MALFFEVVGLSYISSSFSALWVSSVLNLCIMRMVLPSGASAGVSHRDGLSGEAKPLACQRS